MTEEVAKMILDKGLPSGVDFLNLNIPSHPQSDRIRLYKFG
jgi:5'-nucleotidase